MKRPDGYSLIEILIVIVIIGILASIAIPGFLSARRAANEGSAISDLRTFYGAQMTFSATYGGGNYAGDASGAVNPLGFTQLADAKVIDSLLGSGVKSGYNFTVGKVDRIGGIPPSFCGRATPIVGSGIAATGPRNVAIATEGILYAAAADNPTNASCTNVGGIQSVTAAVVLSNN